MPDEERIIRIVQPLRSGQITIPVEFRKRLGITDQTVLQVTLVGHELHIKPLAVEATAGNSAWFKDLYDYFAPVRAQARHMSEEEINTAIDQAMAAVRAKHARRS
jgi:bifunctional DNA-binding transcriptional regulator/antitoxin component of YhaV-PrlF toxin-antitoxin module